MGFNLNLSTLTAKVGIFYDHQIGNSLDRNQGRLVAFYENGKLKEILGAGRAGHSYFKGDPAFGLAPKSESRSEPFIDLIDTDFTVHLDYSRNFRVCDNEELDDIFEQVKIALKEALDLAHKYTMFEIHLLASLDTPLRVYRATDDDWCGNYGLKRDLVEVYMYDDHTDNRVFVGGTDDFYYEKEFSSQSEALKCFKELAARTKINEEDIIRLGFERT